MMLDTHGDSIVPGMLYAVGKGTKKIVSEVIYDLDADVILVRRRGSNDPWCRLDEISDDLAFVPVNADGIELDWEGEPAVENAAEPDACCVDPRESVRSSILRARALKDQLAGIEAELVIDLGADDDAELRDAIMQAIHGDGSADSVLQLIEV
jgi:hypothetical protein